MPAVSQAQRAAIAISEHHPEKLLYKRNKGLLSMKPSDQHDFAATPTKGLPMHAPKVPTDKFGEKVPDVGLKRRKYYGE